MRKVPNNWVHALLPTTDLATHHHKLQQLVFIKYKKEKALDINNIDTK